MRAFRYPLLAAVAAASLTVAGCGSGDDSRDQALAALELTTEAANLQSEMGELVSELSASPSATQRQELRRSLDALDDRAAQLVSGAGADSTPSGDEEASAPEQTAVAETVAALGEARTAGNHAALVVAEPTSDRAATSRERAEQRLHAAAEHLQGSVDLAKRALEEDSEDGLPEQDRALVAEARTAIESARQASRGASAKLEAVIDSAVAAREERIAEREAAQAAAEAAEAAGCFTTAPNSGQVQIDIQGDIPCEAAQSVFQTYYSDATPKMGSGGGADVDGWFCISNSAGAIGRGERSLTICERNGQQIEALLP